MTPRTSRPTAGRRASAPRGTLRVAVLAFPDVQMLDVIGPLEVFSRTRRWLISEGRRRDDAYSVEIVGLERGPFLASSHLRLYATHAFNEVGRGLDTLFVAGGTDVPALRANRRLVSWVRRQARCVRRLASVCTGAFLLAEAGLLDGRRATTHWGSCAQLAADYPSVKVEPDTIFIRDGGLSTSAGVTSGMDLALAMVEEDHGRDVALAVARELVVFLRRPGGQSQFSAQLAAQFAQHAPLSDLQAFIVEHPDADLSVPALARRLAMSPRNFARLFAREVGTTPARYVASVRVETARRLLEESPHGLDAIGTLSGLGSAESLRRAFQRLLGVAPGAYRERFARAGARRTH